MVDFIGLDPGSPQDECPAVYVDPVTGDFYQQGRVVTNPEVLASITKHGPIAADEAVVWQPARMASILGEAVYGNYEPDRQGPGEMTFERFLSTAQRSAIHVEMREGYGDDDPAFQRWRETGSTEYDWSGWIKLIGSAVERGVKVRRVRIVSEPITDYIRWEHAISYGNIEAGEELRWLPRRLAYDLLLPGADLWMVDHRLVRYNFNAGDGHSLRQYEYVSDPRKVAQVVASVEMIWDRAIPHEDYQPS